MKLYEINFKVGRKDYRWCRFANSEQQAREEATPAIENEYYGKKYTVLSVRLTSTEAEDNR